VKWVLPVLLVVGLLTGCESTDLIVSSSTFEEEYSEVIIPPIVEEEEVFEPMVDEPEVGSTVAEPVEQAVESEEDIPQEPREPVLQQSVSEMAQVAPAQPSVPHAQPSLPIPQVPSSLDPQQAVPAEPVQPKTLQDIFFALDQATILSPAKPILEVNAALLQTQYKNRTLLLEGHCDERGSVEYNLVLGVRRAQVVKAYLIDLGIPQSRIRIVSYGKERPVCSQQHGRCWQKNRRTHFLLQ